MIKFRFHVVGLPHTQTTAQYVDCAYTQKVRKFCNMMKDLGHEVFLYASDDNEARVTEAITVISKNQQNDIYGTNEHSERLNKMSWAAEDPAWFLMNSNAIKEIKKRIQPKDFVCLIGGTAQKPIADALPRHLCVEYGIGYVGTFAAYRVFESYAHMHYVYGANHDDNGHFFDAVIPNYYDIDEFAFAEKPPKEPFFLFMGRLVERKGYQIAQQVCQYLGVKLIVAGQAGPDGFAGYGEYVGVVGVEERSRLMSQATAVFVPTTYLEPFGGVHAEANLCGAPVITTNFGVFTETVVNGDNGFRCDTFYDFIEATKKTMAFTKDHREAIRMQAQKRFSTKVVAEQYQQYFERLNQLWGDGWYSLD